MKYMSAIRNYSSSQSAALVKKISNNTFVSNITIILLCMKETGMLKSFEVKIYMSCSFHDSTLSIGCQQVKQQTVMPTKHHVIMLVSGHCKCIA
jgi:hypothetical protein